MVIMDLYLDVLNFPQKVGTTTVHAAYDVLVLYQVVFLNYETLVGTLLKN